MRAKSTGTTNTVKHTRAAQVWAEIEAALLARGFWIRNEQRASLVRLIGDALVGRAQEPLRKTPATAPARRTIVKLRERWHDNKHWDDTVVDATLTKMLERSCSRRVGYDGDDAVEH